MENHVIDPESFMKEVFAKLEEKIVYKKISQLEIEKEFQDVWDFALKRFRFGSIEYGEWNPDEDNRDILEEVKEEIGDVCIYAGMLMIKINRLSKRLEEMGLRK